MRKPAQPLVALVALSACATGASSGTSLNANRISRAEIEEAGPSSAYDLVQKLRPVWLRWRGSTSFTQETDVKVYLDGTGMGEREALRTIDSHNIESIEYLDARRATARFGSGHVNGAILVRTRG
jgi:phage protein D